MDDSTIEKYQYNANIKVKYCLNTNGNPNKDVVDYKNMIVMHSSALNLEQEYCIKIERDEKNIHYRLQGAKPRYR